MEGSAAFRWLLLAVLATLASQVKADQSVDEFTAEMARLIEDNQLSWATVGIMKDHKLIYAKELKRKSGKDVVIVEPKLIPAMDVSHLLACLSVLNLEDDLSRSRRYPYVKLDLNKRLFATNGLFPYQDHAIQDKRIFDITLMEVMQQTIGWGVRDMKWIKESDPNKVIDKALGEQMMWTPGASYNFSVFNEYLLRLVVETHSGLTYESYVKEHILIPLGMFHTRMRSQQDKNGHPKYLQDYTMPLLPSVWHTSMFDVMRLLSAIDGSKGLFSFDLEKLSLIYTRPAAPYPQSTRRWHSAGFLVNNDGSFWSESVTSNGHYLFIHSTGAEVFFDKAPKKPAGPLLVVYVKGMTHKHFKPVFTAMLKKVGKWPSQDLMTSDLVDSSFKDQGLRFRISEHNVKTYMNAVRHAGYRPVWVSAYDTNGRTFFSVIIRRARGTDDENWIFEHGLKTDTFHRRVRKYDEDDIELRLTQTYLCRSHDDTQCHFMLLQPKEGAVSASHVLVELEKTGMDPKSSHGGVFRKAGDRAFQWYYALSKKELETKVKDAASNKFYLKYLQALGKRFVAGFERQDTEKDWVLQNIENEKDLKSEVNQMRASGYFPELLARFPVGKSTHVIVFYGKYA